MVHCWYVNRLSTFATPNVGVAAQTNAEQRLNNVCSNVQVIRRNSTRDSRVNDES